MYNINIRPLDQNGRKHGEWLSYHDNDQLWYRRNFIHDARNGLDEQYSYNGSLWFRGFWNMDRKVGYWFLDKEYKYYLCLI